MEKPTVLIFNARDEIGNLSILLRDAINKIESYNACVITEEKYNRVNSNSFLEFFDDSKLGWDLRTKNHRDTLSRKQKKLNGRDKRIIEAIKRFKPVYIITTSPLSHEYVIEAKIKGDLKTPVIYYHANFTISPEVINPETNLYLLENTEARETLVNNGVDKGKIKTIGLPFELEKLSIEKLIELKQELGLPKAKVILLNLNDIDKTREILTMLVDQGEMLTIGIHVPGTQMSDYVNITNRVQNVDCKMVDDMDKFLKVTDILISNCDTSVMYKAFSLEVPVIGIPENIVEERDFNYLEKHGAVILPKTIEDIVSSVYSVLQTEKKQELKNSGKVLLSFSSIENIAEFLTNFLDYRENGKD